MADDDTAILEKVADDTAIVGKTLEREYGGSHPQDVHIEHFFLLLGTELVEKKTQNLHRTRQEMGCR